MKMLLTIYFVPKELLNTILTNNLTKCMLVLKLGNDPATWKKLSSSDGPPTQPSKFPHDEHENRSFPISVFHNTLPNKERVQGDCLVWSTLKKALFCFPCCIFLGDDKFEPSGFIKMVLEIIGGNFMT